MLGFLWSPGMQTTRPWSRWDYPIPWNTAKQILRNTPTQIPWNTATQVPWNTSTQIPWNFGTQKPRNICTQKNTKYCLTNTMKNCHANKYTENGVEHSESNLIHIDWQEQKIKSPKVGSGAQNTLFHFKYVRICSSGFGEKCPATACPNITSPGYFINTSALRNMYRSTFFKNWNHRPFVNNRLWFGEKIGWIWFYNNWALIPPGPISNKLIGFCLICLKKLLSRKTSNKRKIIKNFNLDENQITSWLRPCKSFLNMFISEESRLRSCMYKLNFLTIIKMW